MSRWTAVSDFDYEEERNPVSRGVERTCSHCKGSLWMSTDEPYVISPICDACDRLIRATQERKMIAATTAKKQDVA